MNKYFLPVYHSELKPWIKWWILKRLNGGQSSLKAVTISSGTLTKVDKSKALSIKEYYGNTVQDGTPTPESPVEIQTISGNITFNINSVNYSLDLKSRNLYEGYSNLQIGWLPNNGAYPTTNSSYPNARYQLIELNTGESITVSNSTGSRARIRYIDKGINQVMGTVDTVGESASSYYMTTASFGSGFTNGTITAKRDLILGILIFEEREDIETVMINEGTTALPYEPYYNYELCKIGDYKDKIYNDNGTWKIEKKVGKIVLNGSEDMGYYTVSSKPVFYVVCNDDTYKIQSGLICYSNYYLGKGEVYSFDNVYDLGNNVIALRTGYQRIVIRNDSITSLADFKTWLGSHNTELYYVLANPTTETITNTNLISQLNALYEFYVNSSKVTISNNSEIPLEVLLEYYGR